MAAVSYSIDSTLIVFDALANSSSTVGLDSIYTDSKHPITGNYIVGWKWDETPWIKPEVLDAQGFIPNIYDATDSGLNHSNYVNGIGDHDDLKVIKIIENIQNDVEYWTPVINHGYYYYNNQEYYLFSDSKQSEIFRQNNVYSGLQYLQLTHTPKYTIPIVVNSFQWDQNSQQYKIFQSFRKKIEFTGTLVSGEELSTINDEYLFELGNIDSTNPEFCINPNIQSGEYIYLNKSYSQWRGDNSSFDNLEVLGKDETDSDVYHTYLSPIDITNGIYIWVDSGTYNPEEWTRIDLEADFTPGNSKEYKVDEILGLIIFGNYSSILTGGSGIEPNHSYTVGAAYSSSVLVEYEPINTQDIAEFKDANINPLYNESASGFIKVKI